MMRSGLAGLLVAMLVTNAAAQPGQDAPPPPPPEAPVAPAPVPADRAQYDTAFDALVRGDFAGASQGFRGVAGTSGSPELRASATELARLADELMRRGGRLSFGPGGPADVGGGRVDAIHEDDTPTGGRTTFVVTTTMAALYSGVVAIDLLDVDDEKAGTALVMASTAAGVIGSLYGTRGRTMTAGMADAWGLGLFVGAGNALLLSGPLGLYDSSSNASEKVQTLTLVSSWGLATAGLIAADKIRPTRAQVSVIQTFGFMGLGSTLLSLAMLQPDNLSGDAFLTITAAGLDGGLVVGGLFAEKIDWSHSRARLVQLSAFLGALAGGGTSILLLSDSNGDNTARAAAGITLAGLWGGFFLGRHLTRDMEPDYRFRRGAQATIAPTVMRDTPGNMAPGLAVVGAF